MVCQDMKENQIQFLAVCYIVRGWTGGRCVTFTVWCAAGRLRGGWAVSSPQTSAGDLSTQGHSQVQHEVLPALHPPPAHGAGLPHVQDRTQAGRCSPQEERPGPQAQDALGSQEHEGGDARQREETLATSQAE